MGKIVSAYLEKNLKKAAEILKKGGLVAFPTETVYGLGANALNPQAVSKIFEVKKRPRFDPLIVHLAKAEEAKKYVKQWPVLAEKLSQAFWPGPLTLVLYKNQLIPSIVTAGLSTVALRVPSHPVAQRLLMEAGVPVAAPSANPFGFVSPTRAEQVEETIGKKVDLILEAGQSPLGLESTVISLIAGKPEVLRLGSLTLEEIENVCPEVKITKKRKILSPGQLKRHYATHTPLKIFKGQIVKEKNAAFLAFSEKPKTSIFKEVKILSPKKDLKEAAANFFSFLYELDKKNYQAIYVEPVPEEGLGRAIMDRIKRASYKGKG